MVTDRKLFFRILQPYIFLQDPLDAITLLDSKRKSINHHMVVPFKILDKIFDFEIRLTKKESLIWMSWKLCRNGRLQRSRQIFTTHFQENFEG